MILKLIKPNPLNERIKLDLYESTGNANAIMDVQHHGQQ